MNVTPIQLLNAYCSLANGGTVFAPRLVNKIETWDGQLVQEFTPVKKGSLPASKETIEAVKYGLWGVCNEPGGTGGIMRRKEASVCGKTGTAQVISLKGAEGKGSIFKYRDHALFVCFAPRDNPEIAIAVVIEHGGHGALSRTCSKEDHGCVV